MAALFKAYWKSKLLLMMNNLHDTPEHHWQTATALNGNNFCSNEYKLTPPNTDAIAACRPCI